MHRLKFFWIFLLMGLVACGQQERSGEEPVASQVPRAMAPAPAEVVPDMAMTKTAGGGEQSLTELTEPSKSGMDGKRYIAMRHALVVEVEAIGLQASFDATVRHCEQLSCQILSASYNRETSYSPPSASLSARIPPRSLEIFLTGLAKSAEVLQHHRQSEDKTDAVIDAEARIKNLTELRDRLRTMLATHPGRLKDVLDVERELASTQSQLDSIHAIRKVLAQETELIAVNVDFQAARRISEKGFFYPVIAAWDQAGRVLMESVAAIISLVAALLPWVIIGIPLIWLGKGLWKKHRVRQS